MHAGSAAMSPHSSWAPSLSSTQETSVPLMSKSEQSKDVYKPTPFREGTSLKPLLLPDESGNMMFEPIVEINSLDSLVSTAIECISGTQLSETVELASFSINEDAKLALPPSMPATIGNPAIMPMVVVPPTDRMSTSARSTKTLAQRLGNSRDGQWEQRFQQLLQFKARHGHCLVPHAYPENPSFARWAKRQRFQYKLLRSRKPSLMTGEKLHKLESVGFVWDPQTTAWEARLMELMQFKAVYGHCNVPCRYPQNPALGAWVKRQRGQYKKYMSGAPTYISPDRFQILTDMGFQWEIRTGRIKKA